MRSVITCWVIVAVLVAFVNAKKSGGVRNINKQVITKPKPIKKYHIKVNPTPDHQTARTREALVSNMMEDRQGDWLARQIREERKLLEKGDLLDLGASHSKRCAANEIKYEHIKEHDDSIDNGEV